VQRTWDGSGAAATALRELVATFDRRVLENPRDLNLHLANLLAGQGLMKERALISAASDTGIAADLLRLMNAGVSESRAVQIVAARLVGQTQFEESGCRWVTVAFARALGFEVSESA
jgi:hypothetical protein